MEDARPQALRAAAPPLRLPEALGAGAAAFEAWLTAARRRCAGDLETRELRKGIQALSSVYVEGRSQGRLAERALAGRGKRAAFACYYAPLHFLTVHALVQAWHGDSGADPAWGRGCRRILDLGCGSGAAGAGLATALAGPEAPPGSRASLWGLDRSGWALGEARHTYRAFGLAARTRRGTLPRDLPPPGGGALALLGWCANELDDGARAALLHWLDEHLARGGGLCWIEPLAGAAAPGWEAARERLEAAGCRTGWVKRPLERPAPIAELDRASGLDHRQLGARFALGPVAEPTW